MILTGLLIDAESARQIATLTAEIPPIIVAITGLIIALTTLYNTWQGHQTKAKVDGVHDLVNSQHDDILTVVADQTATIAERDATIVDRDATIEAERTPPA